MFALKNFLGNPDPVCGVRYQDLSISSKEGSPEENRVTMEERICERDEF